MKRLAIITAIVLAASVGGCNIHKAPVKAPSAPQKVEKVVKVEAPKTEERLQSLESRVSDLERSRAAARRAFKQQQQVVKGF